MVCTCICIYYVHTRMYSSFEAMSSQSQREVSYDKQMALGAVNNLFALNHWFLIRSSDCGSDREEKLQTRATEVII